jgi:hypothetical protein
LPTTISRRSLKGNRRGLSNIVVVVLSLVIIVVIVSNIILWGYQMNQFDWEKAQESVNISKVSAITRSSWFVVQSEYKVNIGLRINGSYLNTRAMDSNYESFRESTPPRQLDINGTFSLDLPNYPLPSIQSLEIQLRYRVNFRGENWYLRAFNWTSRIYSDRGFNSTTGSTPGSGWNYYAVNLTNKWRSYVWNDGRILIKVQDQRPSSTQATLDIDFLGVRAVTNGAVFTFQNKGSLTSHLVSLWIDNSTIHRHYNIDVFVNSAETFSYNRVDIPLSSGQYTVKAVTERGNIAVYTAG